MSLSIVSLYDPKLKGIAKRRKPDLKCGTFIPHILLTAVGFLFLPRSAYAADEIQVYNAEIAEVGQWTIQQHLNYTFLGPMVPPFPGGLVPYHSLNGTPELAYGLTEWWDWAFMLRSPLATRENSCRTDSKFAISLSRRMQQSAISFMA